MLKNQPLTEEGDAEEEEESVASMGLILDSPVIGSAEQDATQAGETDD